MGKKSKKKTKKSVNSMTPKMKKEMAIAYYKRNPDIFVERELGVELYGWQRALLKFLFKRGFKNG